MDHQLNTPLPETTPPRSRRAKRRLGMAAAVALTMLAMLGFAVVQAQSASAASGCEAPPRVPCRTVNIYGSNHTDMFMVFHLTGAAVLSGGPTGVPPGMIRRLVGVIYVPSQVDVAIRSPYSGVYADSTLQTWMTVRECELSMIHDPGGRGPIYSPQCS